MLTEPELANLARHERALRGLSHHDVAELLIEHGRFRRVMEESIQRAEHFERGDNLTDLRIAVVEELTGHKLQGPMWHLAEVYSEDPQS